MHGQKILQMYITTTINQTHLSSMGDHYQSGSWNKVEVCLFLFPVDEAAKKLIKKWGTKQPKKRNAKHQMKDSDADDLSPKGMWMLCFLLQ